jgi:hypothetical protein
LKRSPRIQRKDKATIEKVAQLSQYYPYFVDEGDKQILMGGVLWRIIGGSPQFPEEQNIRVGWLVDQILPWFF